MSKEDIEREIASINLQIVEQNLLWKEPALASVQNEDNRVVNLVSVASVNMLRLLAIAEKLIIDEKIHTQKNPSVQMLNQSFDLLLKSVGEFTEENRKVNSLKVYSKDLKKIFPETSDESFNFENADKITTNFVYGVEYYSLTKVKEKIPTELQFASRYPPSPESPYLEALKATSKIGDGEGITFEDEITNKKAEIDIEVEELLKTMGDSLKSEDQVANFRLNQQTAKFRDFAINKMLDFLVIAKETKPLNNKDMEKKFKVLLNSLEPYKDHRMMEYLPERCKNFSKMFSHDDVDYDLVNNETASFVGLSRQRQSLGAEIKIPTQLENMSKISIPPVSPNSASMEVESSSMSAFSASSFSVGAKKKSLLPTKKTLEPLEFENKMLEQFANEIQNIPAHAGTVLTTELTPEKFKQIISSIEKSVDGLKDETGLAVEIHPDSLTGPVATIRGEEGSVKFTTDIHYSKESGDLNGTMRQVLTATKNESGREVATPPTIVQILTALKSQAESGNLSFNITTCTNPKTIMSTIMLANTLHMEPKIDDPNVISALKKANLINSETSLDSLLKTKMLDGDMESLYKNQNTGNELEAIRAAISKQKAPNEDFGIESPKTPKIPKV